MVVDKQTELARRRYDRAAHFYDHMEALVEARAFRRWREQLWAGVRGNAILELGVGTGKNIPFYPVGAEVTAIDFSPGMLKRAHRRVAQSRAGLRLLEMDAQHLQFPDASFDAVVATFVFCSVPDPVLGLREAGRVLRPDGRLHLLEHVLSAGPVLQPLMNALNPIVLRMQGVNINRTTAENIRAAGLTIESETDLWRDIVKLFVVSSPGRPERAA